MEVLQRILGNQFLGIYSIMFSRGSVLVDSDVRLSSSPPSDSDISNVEAGLTDTFANSSYVIDQISFVKKTDEKGKQRFVCYFMKYLHDDDDDDDDDDEHD